MREQLNENPMAQVGLVVLLVVVAAFMFMRMSGGGEEESESAPTEATVSVEGTDQVGTATGSTPGEAVEGAVASALEATPEAAGGVTGSVPAPPLPRPVTKAYRAGNTIVLLFVDNGGIGDKRVKTAADAVSGEPNVALFVVPSRQIARYAAITLGLEVNRVPALVVVRPRHLAGDAPQGTVDFGFQTPAGVRQAVKDAAYDGSELPYHPR
ncbi:MAG TPA: hypothetical protein VI039_13265 [Solirubrobacterales bacterium]